MDHKELFLKCWEKEVPVTAKVIIRVPEDRSDYRADPKARTAREIAWLMVHELAVLVDSFEKGVFEWVEVRCPAKMSEVVAKYDHESLTKRLHALPPARWDEQMPCIWEGKEVTRQNGYYMAWGFLLDHVHHRAQLSTYLRPMGATVPAIYGSSAGEQVQM